MSVSARVLDQAFRALANPTRRAVVMRLAQGPATVSELAGAFEMALPSFLQHLRVLEECGLIRSEKRGRVRTLRLRSGNLRRAAGWLVEQRGLWQRRLDQLDAYMKTLENDHD